MLLCFGGTQCLHLQGDWTVSSGCRRDARKNCLFCRSLLRVWTVVATNGGKRGYHYPEPMELRFPMTIHFLVNSYRQFRGACCPPYSGSVHSTPEDRNSLYKMWITASRYGVTCLKIWTFTDAAVRTSSLTDPLVFRYRPQSIPQSVFHSWKNVFLRSFRVRK